MANATVKLVMDRLHAINGTISGVKPKRYFPENIQSAIMPFIVPMVQQTVRDRPSVSRREDKSTRTYEILLVIEAWLAGIPTESAQTAAETLIDTVTDAYLARPQLQLSGAALDGVMEAIITGDSGIVPLFENVSVAAVRFNLQVTTIKEFTYATS